MKKVLLLLALLTQTSFAEKIEVDYSRFYTHLKKIDKTQLRALQFSFGFKKVGEATLCDIEQAVIVTQKQSLSLNINEHQRFTLPTEKALNMAKAYVAIDLQQAANQCDMSVQLETKAEYLKQHYEQQELLELSAQYKQFFSDMGSFLSFLMPGSEGLRFTFKQAPIVQQSIKGLQVKEHEIVLTDALIEQAHKGLSFEQKPLRITALVIE